MKKNIGKESKGVKLKKVLARFMFAVMSVTALANSGFFSDVLKNPAGVVHAAMTTDPMQPKNVSVTNGNPFTVVVSWDEVDGASKYYVTYGEPGKATTSTITSKTSVVIKNLKADTTYVFNVKSKYLDDNRKWNLSRLSKSVYHDTMEIPALNISATNTSKDKEKSITLKFDKHDYMSRVYIYRSTDGVNYTNVKTLGVTSTSFVDKNIREGETYYYKVRTYSSNKKHICYGPYSNVVTVTVEKNQKLTPSATCGKTDNFNMQMAYDILDMVNKERVKLGCVPLTMNQDLLNVAAIRSKEIKTKYSHTRPNGKRWSSAYTEAGIIRTGTKGENLMWRVRTAQAFYTAWFNSPGHYRNMMNHNFTQVGICIYEDPATGYKYAVMELAKTVIK